MRQNRKETQRIQVSQDGPYVVHGNVPLVVKTQVMSEHGEPLTWQTGGLIEQRETYDLCRCGHSRSKPLCDVTHALIDFDGTETADPGLTAERQVIHPGGTGIVVKRDYSLCSETGFCGNRVTTVEEMTCHTGDTQVRAQVMAMIERCPSGSYAYALSAGEEDVEPDLPKQIAATVEFAEGRPMDGPLWVSGGIPIERADGQPLETRNRVTLCRCGGSKNKPFCDGTHRPAPAAEAAETH